MKRIAFAVAASVVFWCLIVSFASASELTLIGKSAKPPTLVPWTRSLDITVRVVSLYPFELSNDNGLEWTSWYPGSTTATEIPWTIEGDYSGTKWVYAVVDKRTAGFGYEQLKEKIVYEADNPSVTGLVLNRRSLTTNKRPRIWAYAIPWDGGLKFWGEVKNSKGRRVAGFGKTVWVNNNNYYWTPRGPRTAGYFAAGKYKVTVHAMTYSGRVGSHSFTMTVH